MPPVTCYICGRDFGSRSIGIHLPNCQKKWEAEQEKLPKKERRPLPTAPENFDKVVSGEIKGKDLVKMNQKAFDDYNESSLEPCPFCSRTFLPSALVHHRRSCTEEKPMVKKAGGYTSQMKARVKYPKMKSKSAKKMDEVKVISSTKVEDITTAQNESIKDEDVASDDSATVEDIQIVREAASSSGSISGDGGSKSSHGEDLDEENSIQQFKSKSSIKRGTGTFRKKPTVTKETNLKNKPSRDDIIAFIENEAIFDSSEHRHEIFKLITKYARDARKKQVLDILDDKVFDDENSVEEVAKMMKEFIRLKTNNNM